MAKELKNDSYYTVYYWMSKELGLSGVAKDVYAIIYRFSGGYKGYCYLSYDQFKEITGTSKNTVKRALDNLEDQKLIIRERVQNSNNSHYRVNVEILEGIEGVDLEALLETEEGANRRDDFIEQDPEEGNVSRVF